MNRDSIDPERLAAFLDGRLTLEQRAEMLRQIADSPELLEVVASVARRGSNPFQPRGPTARGTFAGRRKEMEKLSNLLRQIGSGIGTNVLVTGESGTGKSSLLIQFKAIAEERQPHALPFLVIHTDIDHTTTQQGLLAKIEAALHRSLTRSERVRTSVKSFLNFASGVEAAGFRYHKPDLPADEAQMERFADRLAGTVNAATRRRRWPFRARHDGGCRPLVLAVPGRDQDFQDEVTFPVQPGIGPALDELLSGERDATPATPRPAVPGRS